MLLETVLARSPRKYGEVTLAEFGAEVLDERELRGVRDVASERSRWRTHVAGTDLGETSLDAVDRAAVVNWRGKMLTKRAAKGKGHKTETNRKLGRSTIQNTLGLVRIVLGAALERGLIKSNPAADVGLPRAEGRTHEPWTYLLPEEQRALLACPTIPEDQRALIAFAMGTGMREGEVYNLELVDVFEGYVVVRYGSKNKSTKSGKIRRVDLFGIAKAAVAAWLPVLAERKNTKPRPLLFPSIRGERRKKGAPSWWPAALAAAGIVADERHDGQDVRWHDLRHTCASSLVAGWWGRRWALREVQALLGHSTIKMTERYAHLAEDTLTRAARATRGKIVGRSTSLNRSRFRDLNSRPTVYEPDANLSVLALLGADLGPSWEDRVSMLGEKARDALQAMSRGGADAYRVPVEVLGELAAFAAMLEADQLRDEDTG